MNILKTARAQSATQELYSHCAHNPAAFAGPLTFQPLTFNAQLPTAFHPRKQGIQCKKHLNLNLAFSPYPLAFLRPSLFCPLTASCSTRDIYASKTAGFNQSLLFNLYSLTIPPCREPIRKTLKFRLTASPIIISSYPDTSIRSVSTQLP